MPIVVRVKLSMPESDDPYLKWQLLDESLYEIHPVIARNTVSLLNRRKRGFWDLNEGSYLTQRPKDTESIAILQKDLKSKGWAYTFERQFFLNEKVFLEAKPLDYIV
jgi:hypothetical protein